MNRSGDRSRGSCCSLLVALVLLPIFLWLTLRPDHPSCSIKNFYLPALDRSSDSPTNTTIFMDLRLSNGNKEKGVLYDPINVTVRYFQDPNRTALWVGQVPGFKQGHKKKATKKVAVGTLGVNWTDAVARNYSMVFRVDLSTRVKFQIMFWKTKRHGLNVGANVTVNELGVKNTEKNINLKSAGEPKNGRCCCCRIGVLLVGFVFHLHVL